MYYYTYVYSISRQAASKSDIIFRYHISSHLNGIVVSYVKYTITNTFVGLVSVRQSRVCECDSDSHAK